MRSGITPGLGLQASGFRGSSSGFRGSSGSPNLYIFQGGNHNKVSCGRRSYMLFVLEWGVTDTAS